MSRVVRFVKRFLKPEFLKFVGYGVISYPLAVGTTLLLTKVVQLDRKLAYGIAQVAVLCVNFVVSKFLIFEPSKRKNPFYQFGLFAAVNTGFRLADWGIFTLLSLGIRSIPVASFISAASVLPFKFLLMRKGVF